MVQITICRQGMSTLPFGFYKDNRLALAGQIYIQFIGYEVVQSNVKGIHTF